LSNAHASVVQIRYVHDMRELTIPIRPQPATTRDNVRVDVGGMELSYFQK
jgi:hypothetical protein